MAFILGIDAGNYETKVCSINGVNSFPSDIGEFRKRKLVESFGKDDIVWEYNGEKGFAGTLAKFESEYGGTMKGKTKAHSEGILRVLIALHKYGEDVNKIIVGQPIDAHDEEEKEKIKELLNGKHTIKVNGIEKDIIVEQIEVAPEGSAAILSSPENGLIRIIDIGSGTTNFATLYNLKRIDRDSFTKQIGTEIMRNKESIAMAKGIYKIISGVWDKEDVIYLTGGGAEGIFKHLEKRLPNCKIMKPRIGNSLLNTKYANVVGFYTIAKGLFENE